MKYYFYRVYTSKDEPLGYLYTAKNEKILSNTTMNLGWCKKWKTRKGAERNFDSLNKRWQEEHPGSYLKIEECEWEQKL